MSKFKVCASEGLWNISGGCGCGPEFMGIQSEVEAESCEDAIRKILLFMEFEWMYDLNGEWIRVEGDSRNLRYRFESNLGYVGYIGKFTYHDKEYLGTVEGYEDRGDDELPLIDELIFVTDLSSGDVVEKPISCYMPNYVISELLDVYASDLVGKTI